MKPLGWFVNSSGTDKITFRWTLYSAILIISCISIPALFPISPYASLYDVSLISLSFGLTMAFFFWALSHPFRFMMVRYARALHTHSTQLVQSWIAILVSSLVLVICIGCYFSLNPDEWNRLSLLGRMPCLLPNGVLLVSIIELATCYEYARSKRLSAQ